MNNELIEKIVAAAIYEFGGYLTSRDKKIIASSTDNAAPMAEAIAEFLGMKNICSSGDIPVKTWQELITQQQEAEPEAWISRVKCVGPEYGKERYGKLPVQSLNPLYYEHVPLYIHPPKPAAQPTMDDAIAAGNGTLHGAIDYWQQRALKAEAAQPRVAEPCKACHGSGKLVLHGKHGAVAHEYDCSLCAAKEEGK